MKLRASMINVLADSKKNLIVNHENNSNGNYEKITLVTILLEI